MSRQLTTNNKRAGRAVQALRAYQRIYQGPGDSQDDFRDLLTDMLHLCRRTGWDFERNLADARGQYWREVAEKEATQNLPDES